MAVILADMPNNGLLGENPQPRTYSCLLFQLNASYAWKADETLKCAPPATTVCVVCV